MIFNKHICYCVNHSYIHCVSQKGSFVSPLCFIFMVSQKENLILSLHIDVAGSKTLTWEVKYTVCVTHVFVL